MSTFTDTEKSNLKKKIGMMKAILPALRMAKGVAGSDTVKSAEEKLTAASECFEKDQLVESNICANEAGQLIKTCAKMVPKTPRKLLLPQIERILKY